jgi:hypothetical protein
MASFSFSQGLQINKVNLNIGVTAFPPKPSIPVPTRPLPPLGGPTAGLNLTVPLSSNVQLRGDAGVNLNGQWSAGATLQIKY